MELEAQRHTPLGRRLIVHRGTRRMGTLRQANEILRKASAYFAVAELDRRSKP